MVRTEQRALRYRPRRIAAVAPRETEEQHAERQARTSLPPEVDATCQEWAFWVSTRHIYGPSKRLQSVLGQLRTSKATAIECPRVMAGGILPHFHLASLSLSEREQAVLALYYVHRARPIKRVADLLGIGRQHFYVVLRKAATTAYAKAMRQDHATTSGL